MKLYEITNEYQSILSQLEHAEGEDRLPLLAKLDEIAEPLESKAINLAKYINNIRATSKSIDEEIERLVRMKKAVDQRESNMVEYLEFNMKRCNITKIESPLFKIQFQKTPPKVEVINEDEVPAEYKKTKTEVSLDKLKIRDEMKVGVIIPGVQLVQSEKLVIK